MKPIEKHEMFAHVSEFLKSKGIELKDGGYTKGIEKSCGILTDAINLSQQGIRRAKTELGRKVDQVRQVIHEKTAPPPPPAPPANAASPNPNTKTKAQPPRPKARKPKPGKPTS
jgi:hypothetical protein